MMKFASILKSRGIISMQLLNLNKTTQNVNGLHSLMSSAGISTSGQNISTNDQIYAQYAVYKGKAALTATPVSPTFAKLKTGISVKRQGTILLCFTPSVGERKYDWERRQYFALSTTEVGSLINLSPTGSCEFFHDPSMKTSNAGEVRKSLSIKALADGSGYFFSLTVANNAMKTNERFTVPVTAAEFAVMRTSFSFALPHIMGWDRYFSHQQSKPEENSANAGQRQFKSGYAGQGQLNIANAGPRQLNSEWDR